MTHCNLLHLICNDISVNVQLYLRFLKFVSTCHKSKHPCVTLCVKVAVNGSGSKMANSLSKICHTLNLSRYDTTFNFHAIKESIMSCVTTQDAQKKLDLFVTV